MTTYPSECLPLQSDLLMDGTDPNVWYTSPDGKSKFYILGGMAPFPGIPGQDGIVCNAWPTGLTPTFKHLDQQAAMQDGTTWQATVYDPMTPVLPLEAHASTPQGLSRLVSEWIGAWDPKNPGTLEYFTLDRGYWYCKPRLFKTWQDQENLSPRRALKKKLTHAIRVDDAFWAGIDSTSEWGPTFADVSDDFAGDDPTGLGSNWTQAETGSGTGMIARKNGAAYWKDTGNNTRTALARYHTDSTTDNQIINVSMALATPEYITGASIIIRGRVDNAGNEIRVRIQFEGITLSRFNAGVETVLWWQPTLIPVFGGATWTLVCGNSDGARVFEVLRAGFRIIRYAETGTGSVVGAGHRGWGFGMESVETILGESFPPAVTNWSAADNRTVAQSGFINLTNIGDQPGPPRYLLYGPGTFQIANGPGSNSMITLGPLLDGQIVLVTTMERLRSVIDVTPAPLPTQQLNLPQELLVQLIDLVTNNNAPPLLQQFESLFGIMPPQGNLWAQMKGRFTNEGLIPGVSDPGLAETQHIAVSVTDAAPNTKIVAALTPFRRWPE